MPGCSCHWASTEGTSFRSVLEAESCPLRHPEIQAPLATRVPAPPETVAFSSERDDSVAQGTHSRPASGALPPLLSGGRLLARPVDQAGSSQTWRGLWGQAGGCGMRTTWLESAASPGAQRGERGQQGDTLRASLPIPCLPLSCPPTGLTPAPLPPGSGGLSWGPT